MHKSVQESQKSRRTGSHLVSALTYAMFFMFAMTTDAVGEIIKIQKTGCLMPIKNQGQPMKDWRLKIRFILMPRQPINPLKI